MQYPLCRHIHARGNQCGSPALATGELCFFHQRLADRHRNFHHTGLARQYLVPGQHIELSPLEDRESVQLALSVVINALASGQLEPRRATALLYGLQLASMNSGSLRPARPSEVVRTLEHTADGQDLAEPGSLTRKPIRL